MRVKSHYWYGSVIGESHIKLGLPNQDRCLGKHYPWGDLVVVADGVGSCPKSEIGSLAACHSAAEGINICIRKGVNDFQRMHQLIHALWLTGLGDVPPRQACSTCRIAFTLEEQLYCLSIGDGMTAICGNSPENTVIIEETKEEQFVNETFALSDESQFSVWHGAVFPLKEYRGVLLTTDGVSENYRRETRPRFAYSVMNSFALLKPWNRRREIKMVFSRLSRGNLDDKSMICLYWGEL